MGFLDSLTEGITSGDFLSGAFQAGASTLLGLYNADRAEEKLKEDYAREDKKTALQIKLEALKAKYANPVKKETQEHLQGKHLDAMGEQTNQKQRSIETLIAALQGPLRR